ncbi:hypothetical protein FRC12_004985 [Ceratobasidium sp. 428]|nr:hypothetical protein FRC12_004985 [Ceratobasidium sp. 428]
MSMANLNPSQSNFEFIFHGTGSSSSLPNITCLTSKPVTCETCASTLTPEGEKNKRRNTGGIVRMRGSMSDPSSERVLVIDVGKTFLAAALDLFPQHDLRRIDAVLLTHGHADAVNGLDDLRTWTLGKNRIQDHIDVYLSPETMQVISRSFPYLVSKEHATGSGNVSNISRIYPLFCLNIYQVAEFKWHIIEESQPFEIEGLDIDITPVAVHHGWLAPHKRSNEMGSNGHQGEAPLAAQEPYMCFGFMFADILIYMSDVSYIPDTAWEVISARSGSFEAFIVDCLRIEHHVSHYGIKVCAVILGRAQAQNPEAFNRK